jgi:hypothetical protein
MSLTVEVFAKGKIKLNVEFQQMISMLFVSLFFKRIDVIDVDAHFVV